MEGSKEFTSFGTPFGHFQFTELQFVLHGAPAIFQRLMDRVRRDTEAFAAAYIYDIIIYDSSWDQHVQHMQHVFSLIKKAGLTIHPDKCALAKGRNLIPWLSVEPR